MSRMLGLNCRGCPRENLHWVGDCDLEVCFVVVAVVVVVGMERQGINRYGWFGLFVICRGGTARGVLRLLLALKE